MIDGKKSEDYNLFIQRTPLIETPTRRVELREAFGVHGGVPFDERAYNNTEMQLLMFIDGDDLIKDREQVDALFRNTGVFKEFIPYWDPDKIYYVMNLDKTQYESFSWYGEKQVLQATLTVKPYKYLVEPEEFEFPVSRTITNPFEDVSQPIFVIEGNGDITLTVNGTEYFIQNVVGSITIDSERYSAYKQHTQSMVTNENDKYMQKQFPIFTPGENSINVSTRASKITVYPRWRSLV